MSYAFFHFDHDTIHLFQENDITFQFPTSNDLFATITECTSQTNKYQGTSQDQIIAKTPLQITKIRPLYSAQEFLQSSVLLKPDRYGHARTSRRACFHFPLA